MAVAPSSVTETDRARTAFGTAWRWLTVIASLLLPISAVSVIGRGFRAMGDERALFFPLELLFHPLERISGWLTDLLYGTACPIRRT